MKYVKRRAERQVRKVVDVAVTDTYRHSVRVRCRAKKPLQACQLRHWLGAALIFLLSGSFLVPRHALAAVLPEARSDLMYHYYSGGDDVTVQGPAGLVRVNANDNVAVSARYYIDTISAASPDVVSAASRYPYEDKREEFGLGVDLLHGNSLVQLSMSSSKEKDYEADTFSLGTTHDLFGGLTTVSFGYGQGQDQITRVDNSFQGDINRYHYRLGLTQVLTRSILLGVNYEGIAEEGYLNNPYRSARVLGASQPEIYPGTRDSQAFAVRVLQGFPSTTRAVGSSLRAEYRYFRDNWGVRSNTLSLAYQKYFGKRWMSEVRYRYYNQSAASFFSDNFDVPMTYMARDKELSTFQSHSIGARATWDFLNRKFLFFERASLNLGYDYILFDYQDYTNILTGQPYSFGAHVIQFFISAWY